MSPRAERQPVCVIALEQQLRGSPADAERVSECCDRDRFERSEQLAAAVVEAVDTAKPSPTRRNRPRVLEVHSELLVVDLRDSLLLEPRLELGRRAAPARRATPRCPGR